MPLSPARIAINLYASHRMDLLGLAATARHRGGVVRETEGGYTPVPINERLVQCLWYDQRLQREPLRLVDGRIVRVLFQGWWNLESGPDFTHATIQIGSEPPLTGSVEIHLRAEDWFQHRHQADHAYDDVVLHVVLWRAGSERVPRTAKRRTIPQLVLEDQLDSSLEALYDEIDLDAYPHGARHHEGRCAPVLAAQAPATVVALLEAAGRERFEVKTRRYRRWIQRRGDAQAFYEAWMEALGYKSNKRAFRQLAERLPLRLLSEQPRHLAPLLFGVANFLPVTASRDTETRRLWNAWWKLRPDHQERVLSVREWQLGGIRPANHPHRRLGAAVALLRKHPDLLAKVSGAIESGGDPRRLFLGLRDDYWSHHYRLGGRRTATAADLIGPARADELMANVVLPFLAARARQDGDPRLEEKVVTQFTALPAARSNSVVRLAAGQLFASAREARARVRTACQQQGLLQVFHDFCLNDRSGCRDCLFPELVRRWTAERS